MRAMMPAMMRRALGVLLLAPAVSWAQDARCGAWGFRNADCVTPCTFDDDCYDYTCAPRRCSLHPSRRSCGSVSIARAARC